MFPSYGISADRLEGQSWLAWLVHGKECDRLPGGAEGKSAMAGSVNKVILVGNLGRDPEVRNTQDGQKIVQLSVATSETWNDRASGERKERTEWHRVVIFNDRIAEVAERYLKKGAKIYCEGSLQTRKWTDQSGQEKYTTEVVIGRFRGELTMLDGRGEGGGMGEGGGGSYAPRERSGGMGGSQRQERPAAGGGRGGPSWDAPRGGDLDDEIPF
jgi:single-strand DNA-binding protein